MVTIVDPATIRVHFLSCGLRGLGATLQMTHCGQPPVLSVLTTSPMNIASATT